MFDWRNERFTLPTPVGPKNKKEATGRFGACNPARDIRTASLTEDKTSSWPTTRFRRASSIWKTQNKDTNRQIERERWESIRVNRTWTSLSLSPFKRFCTGIPVALATTHEMSLEVTRSWNITIGDSSIASDSLSEGLDTPSRGKWQIWDVTQVRIGLLVELLPVGVWLLQVASWCLWSCSVSPVLF